MVRAGEQAQSSLPDAYRRWRASRLGKITDALEEALLLELIGSPGALRILDAGCGDGALATALAGRGANMTGVDADPHMLAAGRVRAEGMGMNLTFVEGDVRALPFPDASFDVVVAVTVLCFVPDAQHAVREMARVMRPGGRMVIGELGRWNLWAAKRRIKGWLGSATWRAAKFRTAHELERLVRSAGLDVTATRGAIFYPPCGSAGVRGCFVGALRSLARAPHDDGCCLPRHRGKEAGAINRPKLRALHASCEIAANPGRKDPFRPVRLHAGEPPARGAKAERPCGIGHA